MKELIQEEALEGVWNTVILTQIVLAVSGLLALAAFPFASHHFVGKYQSKTTNYLLVILRTTPEYILAYIFIQLWGPSMLPALVALSLHNGAILGFLSSKNSNLIRLELDATHKRINLFFYEILPRIFGQFLAFLFYRWEVMMRESAILGILGIYTLGFYIDSAIADDQLDKAMILILITSLLNMGIDSISQVIRRKLKVSTKLVTS